MATQLSQDVTPPPKSEVKVKRLLAGGHLPRALDLARWAAYVYAAQAVAGFVIGLALPWVQLFTK